MQRSPQLRFHNSRQKKFNQTKGNQGQMGIQGKQTSINKRKKQKLLALVAITEPRKADEKNKYANVGTFIVIRGPVSPMKFCQESAHK